MDKTLERIASCFKREVDYLQSDFCTDSRKVRGLRWMTLWTVAVTLAYEFQIDSEELLTAIGFDADVLNSFKN